MGNILFQNRNNNNDILKIWNELKKQGPSDFVFNQEYMSNPRFKQFADSVKGKTPEQAFGEFGRNFDQFRHLKW